MNEKEIAEVRRSLSLQKNALTKICGCYVNAAGEIISCFEQSLGLMSEEETEKYLAIFATLCCNPVCAVCSNSK